MVKPTTYDEWKDCITIKCGIELTPNYVRERLDELADKKNFKTSKLIEFWGEPHYRDIVTWFQTAAEELNQTSGSQPG